MSASEAAPAARAAPLSPRRARALVLEIAQRYFGRRPRRLVPCGGGLSNVVFEFRIGDADYVVRLHAQPGQLNSYLKEQWVMAEARRAGVPTPEVLEVHNEAVGVPYMVARKVAGIAATHHPQRLAMLGELGRLAARLHRVRTHGYGEVFDWSSNRLSQCASWGAYLDDTLGAARCIAVLRRTRMLRPAQLDALQAAVAEMRGWRKPPVLNHGDLRLKNLIVEPASGEVLALIDWDNALSAPSPHWDLAIALHDLGVDAQEAFLEGYGITPRAYAQALPFMRALNTLNYAQAIEALDPRRDAARLAWYRERLQGRLSLYLPAA